MIRNQLLHAVCEIRINDDRVGFVGSVIGLCRDDPFALPVKFLHRLGESDAGPEFLREFRHTLADLATATVGMKDAVFVFEE